MKFPKWLNPFNWFKLQQDPRDYLLCELTLGLDELNPGDVILHSNRKFNLVSAGIRAITHSPVSHASIYFGSGRHMLIEALDNGIVERPIDAYLNNDAMLRVFRFKRLTVDSMEVVKAYMRGCVGKPYDWGNVLAFLWGGQTNSQGKLFCSELAVRAYAEAGITISKKVADKTSPDDLLDFFRAHTRDWELVAVQNVRLV